MMIFTKACAVLAATAFLVSAADKEPGGHTSTIRKGGGTSPSTTSHGLFVGPAVQSSSSATLRRGTAATAAVVHKRELKPDDLDKEKVMKIEEEMADLMDKMNALLNDESIAANTNLDDLRTFANAVADMKKNELEAYLSDEGKALFSFGTRPKDMEKLSKTITALVEEEAKLKKDLLKQRLKLVDEIEARLADVKEEIEKLVEELKLEANDVQALRDLLAGEDLVGKKEIEARLGEMQANGLFGDANIKDLKNLFSLIEEEAQLEEDLLEQIPKLLENINARLEDLQLEINQLAGELGLASEDVASLRALFEQGQEPTKDEIEAIFPNGPSFKDLKELIALLEEEAELEVRIDALEETMSELTPTSTPLTCQDGETLVCVQESSAGPGVFSQVCVANFNSNDLVDGKEVAALGCCSTDHVILTAMFASTGIFTLEGPNAEGCPAFSSIRGEDLVGTFECKTGTAAAVTAWCQESGKGRNCCPGTVACAFWKGENTVCQGSCNSNFACSDVSAGFFASPGSCIAPFSCALMAYEKGTSAVVGSNSCVEGGSNCYEVGRYKATSVSIGANSCVKQSSCQQIGYTFATSVSIGASSCTESYSCFFVGYYGAASVSIGANSCVKESSCKYIGDTQATSVSVGASSCTERYSCFLVGTYNAASVSIEANACKAVDQCRAGPAVDGLYTGSAALPGNVVCTTGDGDTCESK